MRNIEVSDKKLRQRSSIMAQIIDFMKMYSLCIFRLSVDGVDFRRLSHIIGIMYRGGEISSMIHRLPCVNAGAVNLTRTSLSAAE